MSLGKLQNQMHDKLKSSMSKTEIINQLSQGLANTQSNVILLQENEKLKKEIKHQKREHDRDIAQKNLKINNLLTDMENTKTDLQYTNK